jgi:hypothetical protein
LHVTAPYLSTEFTFYLEELCNSFYYFGSYCSQIYDLLHILLLSTASEPGAHSLSNPRTYRNTYTCPSPCPSVTPKNNKLGGYSHVPVGLPIRTMPPSRRKPFQPLPRKWMSGDSCSRRFSLAERPKVECASGQVPGVH